MKTADTIFKKVQIKVGCQRILAPRLATCAWNSLISQFGAAGIASAKMHNSVHLRISLDSMASEGIRKSSEK